jgi:hypothetical protein
LVSDRNLGCNSDNWQANWSNASTACRNKRVEMFGQLREAGLKRRAETLVAAALKLHDHVALKLQPAKATHGRQRCDQHYESYVYS